MAVFTQREAPGPYYYYSTTPGEARSPRPGTTPSLHLDGEAPARASSEFSLVSSRSFEHRVWGNMADGDMRPAAMWRIVQT